MTDTIVIPTSKMLNHTNLPVKPTYFWQSILQISSISNVFLILFFINLISDGTCECTVTSTSVISGELSICPIHIVYKSDACGFLLRHKTFVYQSQLCDIRIKT